MQHKKTAIGGSSLFILLICMVLSLSAHEWMAPNSAAKIKNPVKREVSSINEGKISYLRNCTACHGEHLEGLSAEETGLKMNSPNLKQRILNHSDGDFFWKIQEGRGEMPSFKEDFADVEIWNIINYIRDRSER